MAALALGFEGSDESLIARMDDAKERWNIHVKRTVDDVPVTWEGQQRIGTAQTVEPITNLTGRAYLQNFGSHARQVFGDTFWIDQVLPNPMQARVRAMAEVGLEPEHILESKMQQRYPDADIVTITDLRYPNEAERIKLLGGTIWEVQRPGLVSDGHSSEQPLPRELVDWEIVNDGTLDVLKARVAQAMFETLR